jgi:hypothetical protein
MAAAAERPRKELAMPRFSSSRIVLLVVLTLMLAVPSLGAGEPFWSGPSAVFSADFLARLWDFFASAWSKNGCRIDPDGRCVASPEATVTTDNGCRIDPNGHCFN